MQLVNLMLCFFISFEEDVPKWDDEVTDHWLAVTVEDVVMDGNSQRWAQ